MRISFFLIIAVLLTQFVYSESITRINGVSFVSLKYKNAIQGIDSIYRINANWIALCPFAYLYRGKSEVVFNTKKNWWGDTEEGLRAQIKKSRSAGLKVFIKPHCWLMNEAWAGNFSLSGKTSVAWEQNYSNYILFLAKIAQSEQVEMLGIGTEMQLYSKLRGSFFSTLIDKVRTIYKGKLTYCANFEEFGHVQFWNKLDYIGIDAYFPLSSAKTPSVEELLRAWKNPVLRMKQLSLKYNKKIILTEYGYKSIDRAAYKQWEFERTPTTEKINFQAQINAYTALYKAVWTQNFVSGGFCWKWQNEDANLKHNSNSDYTPQHKPVEKIIVSWYSLK